MKDVFWMILAAAATFWWGYHSSKDKEEKLRQEGRQEMIDAARYCIMRADDLPDADRCLFGGNGIRGGT